MANVSVTAASVLKSEKSTKLEGIAGEAILAGELVYKHTDNKYYLADNNDLAAKAVVAGIALNGAAAGQPFDFVKEDKDGITLGSAVLTVGTIYALSATAGKICPIDDLVSGNRVSVVGVAITTGKLMFRPINSGVAVPA